MVQETKRTGGSSGGMSAEDLVRAIAQYAARGDFAEADGLYEQLMAEHPMELTAVIRAGETLEEQKAKQIDKDHLAVWDELYKELTEEEKICLFYSLKSASVDKGKILLRQGKATHRLIFIESGRVALFHTHNQERVLLGQLGRGEFFGEETFFAYSNPTFSAGSQSGVTVRFLDKKATLGWEEKQPGLFRKLADFCARNPRATQLMQEKELEKRHFERINTTGKVKAFALAADGARNEEYFRGSVMDISRGGLNFDTHSSKQAKVLGLLGRKLEMEVVFGTGDSSLMVKLQGLVVKVGILLHNDYSVHVQLQPVLAQDVLDRFLATG